VSRLNRLRKTGMDSDSSKAVMTLTLAAVLLGLGLVASNYFVKSLNFHRKVFSQKSSVAKKLESNQKSLIALREEFVANEKTGPTSDEVFASLPTSKDFPQTSSTLESIIKRSGVEMQSISLNSIDELEEGETAKLEYAVPDPKIGTMALSVEVSGSYENFADMLKNLEKSSRVFKVNSLEVAGADDRINATLQIETYYQQAVDNSIKTEVIKL
jgi:Tfp pilus assembly protein PilO